MKLTRSYWNLPPSNFEVALDYFFTAGGWGECTWDMLYKLTPQVVRTKFQDMSLIIPSYLWLHTPHLMHPSRIKINQPTRCNNFTSLLLDVYVWFNMFRVSPRPSSGVYNCTRSLWFYCWREVAGRLLVVVCQTTTNNAPVASLQR